MTEIQTVEVENPENMHLLGLMLSLVLDNNKDRAKFVKLGLPPLAMNIDGMELTLSFEQSTIHIRKGADSSASAKLTASMNALLGAALKFDVVKPFLTGNLKISGNPVTVGKWLPLMLP